MKGLPFLIAAGIAAALSLGLVGCSATDVVAKVANTSFEAVVDASADRGTWSSADAAWSLSSPSGDEVLFSADFARNNTAGASADMTRPDVEFRFDAAPFIAAGLVFEQLPRAEGVDYALKDGRLVFLFELGGKNSDPAAQKSFEATFARIVETQRDRIGYHEKLDHYGIMLGNGNMFEWAKDLGKNDKDIVWVLNPEPLIAAGVDPAKIDGWVFAKVETKDDKGKTIFVDKLLKPFDIK
jgi:hypothetical protein